MRAAARVILPMLLLGTLGLGGLGLAAHDAGASVVVRPGPALEIGRLLTVPDHPRVRRPGGFYLTSVSIDPNVDLVEWLAARAGVAGELQPNTRLRPYGLTPDDYRRLSRHLLDESTTIAKVVALRRAGYPVTIEERGARVTAVLPGRPADGPVRASDLIVAVDGAPVRTAAETAAAIRRRVVGQPVTLTLQRDGVAGEVTLPTVESGLTPGAATVGVTVLTDQALTNLPFEISIDAGALGGPSAGLMFTLTILHRLGPTDLTHGHRIAGSGTIALDETVGPIDGVRFKVTGAERAGARYFLAPHANVAEARAAATRLTVVEVTTLQEALDFLATLPDA